MKTIIVAFIGRLFHLFDNARHDPASLREPRQAWELAKFDHKMRTENPFGEGSHED